MPTEMAKEQAAEMNETRLRAHPYPGRGIIMGVDESGLYAVQIYWIMGRSDNSRNRVFKHADGRVFTDAIDVSKVSDPSLIMYNAMSECGRNYIVSNGDQTDTIFKQVSSGGSFASAMRSRSYEPDKPNFTPRIAGIFSFDDRPPMEIGIILKDDSDEGCVRKIWGYESLARGYGYCIHTYEPVAATLGKEHPLPSFVGQPFLLRLRGPVDELANVWWPALNADNRVALVVKVIPLSGAPCRVMIINAGDWTG